ncbi:MAG: hypothetical protein V7676_11035 [Parasphingorhabdus sp.]|uniref:hypothetical protein n=1 Tax=Parasphingorhabdus sp. TaxID=2709688 RepID=UPI003002089A
MKNQLLSFAFGTAILISSAPAAADQGQQIATRTQVTVSARIISGEILRFGAEARSEDTYLPSHSRLERTQGQIIVDGQANIAVTEFH